MVKLVSWNVNGLRSCISKGNFDDVILGLDADVVCVQETKMARGQAEIDYKGYRQYWNSADKKGYSGTAVFTKAEPIAASYGIGIDAHDHEGRVILLEFADFNLVNIYTPNSKDELLRLGYRMEWEDDVRAWLKRVEASSGKPVVLCGDLNVAHEEIDLKHPRTNHRNAGFTDEERGKMTELLAAGFYDTYRHFYPERRDAYTWWSFIGKARERNTGWRIDYFLVSAPIIDNVSEAVIYSEIYGSDHCPVGVSLDLSL